ncbi:hypothetical protein V7793_21470, partial [Streptomyces sp. KLMMK]|uniref:hypothetical protein n=1 Tax=Streptomyces sp. KLMMK TaxID=3109353 RepID=UPI003009F9BA
MLATAAALAMTGEAAADDGGASVATGNTSVNAVLHRLPSLLPPHPPSHVAVNALGGNARAEVTDNGQGCLDITAHVLTVDAEVWLKCRNARPPAPAPPAPAPPAPAPPAPPAPAPP